MMSIVKNLPATHKEFVVARAVDGELWFWGSWDSEETAHMVAIDIDGIVVYEEE